MRRLFICLPLLLTAACGEELIESTGKSFELTDAAPVKTFRANLAFTPEGTRPAFVEALTAIAELTPMSNERVEVTASISAWWKVNGRFGRVELGGEPSELSTSIGDEYCSTPCTPDQEDDYRVVFEKRGAGTIAVDWRMTLDHRISDYPEDARDPEVEFEIVEVEE